MYHKGIVFDSFFFFRILNHGEFKKKKKCIGRIGVGNSLALQ